MALKALYGTVDATKFFFDKLSSFLIDELGFVRSSYDECVLNKQVKGKQCTILFHVDDLKIPHVNHSVVMDIVNSLSKKYRDIMLLSISRGKVHEYLGMTFGYSKKE